MTIGQGTYGKGQRAMEYTAIAVFSCLVVLSVGRAALALEHFSLSILVVAMIGGWLLADLLSGVVHWSFDSFGSASTPIIGAALIRPFREHHLDPEAMTQHDFVETHGASCLAALPFLLLTVLMPIHSAFWLLVNGVLLFAAIGALMINQCHKWAHMHERELPDWVRRAQRVHLLLPPAHHRLHHTSPFNTHFCMACGWMNPLLNRMLRMRR